MFIKTSLNKSLDRVWIRSICSNSIALSVLGRDGLSGLYRIPDNVNIRLASSYVSYPGSVSETEFRSQPVLFGIA